MRILERKAPPELIYYETLLKYLPKTDPDYPKIEKSFQKRKWGFIGEARIDYYLRVFEKKRHLALFGLSIRHNQARIQNDNLLIFPTFTALIETKHWSGTVEAKSNGDFIRLDDGEAYRLGNPVDQVRMQAIAFSHFLKEKKIQLPPIRTFVFFSNDRLIIGKPEHMSSKCTRGSAVISALASHNAHGGEKEADWDTLRAAANKLKKHHRKEERIIKPIRLEQDIAERVKIFMDCAGCQSGKLKRHSRCTTCGRTLRDSWLESMLDYAIVKGNTIKTAEVQTLFGCESRQKGYRFLKELGCTPTGWKAETYYDLNESPKLIRSYQTRLDETLQRLKESDHVITDTVLST